MQDKEIKAFRRQNLINSVLQPLVAIILGLLVGAAVIISCKQDPVTVYAEMFTKSFSPTAAKGYYLLTTLIRATPIIICAQATAIAWRAGYINLGVESQMIWGGFVSAVIALYCPGPTWLVFILAWIGGISAGMLYALIPTILTRFWNVSMVITTLMMNYVAKYITSYFVTYPLRDTAGDGLSLQTPAINEAMQLPRLSNVTNFSLTFVIACVVVLLTLFITKRTVFGFESKMVGFNSSFARYGGVKSTKVMFITMALSGGIGAIAGCNEVFGTKYRYTDGMFTSTSYAWTGLMAALIAGLDPVGMFAVSIFLAGLQVGGSAIQRSCGLSVELATIIQCCITLFVAVKLTFRFVKKKKADKAAGVESSPAEVAKAVLTGKTEAKNEEKEEA